MLHTIEVEIDGSGHVRAVEPAVQVPAGRALLTLLGPDHEYGSKRYPIIGDGLAQAPACHEPVLMAERALGEDWLRPEEDAAWAYLQRGTS